VLGKSISHDVYERNYERVVFMTRINLCACKRYFLEEITQEIMDFLL